MRFLRYYFIIVAVTICAVLTTCGVAHVHNDLAAARLLSSVKDIGLPPAATALKDGTAVGNFSSTGNNIDLLAYRIVRITFPEQLEAHFSDYVHKPAKVARNEEPTIERPWIEVIALNDLTSTDPYPIRDQELDLLKRYGRNLYAVFAVVRYSDGTFDWRGW